MTSIQPSNAGGGLMDFNPPPRGEINSKNNTTMSPTDFLPSVPSGSGTNTSASTFPLIPPTANSAGDVKNTNVVGSAYTPHGITGSNYQQIYEPTSTIRPYYSKTGTEGFSTLGDDRFMQKINYMIHLLEEQKNEKTANITEEFILYTFLGIFIIYVADTFSRSGKYIR